MSSIADKARGLREAFREQYGVEVHITIHAYDGPSNPQLNCETAEKMSKEMASVFNGPAETKHGKGDRAKWFRVNPSWEEKVEIILFYEDEEAPHEQNN